MPSGPARTLEAIVRFLLPPACREEVLGDLHEKYTGPRQYIALAICVIPLVVLSRIRRTTDTLVLLTEALLIYGSFLAAAWYTDRTSLTGDWGLLRLVIPTALNLVVQILEHAWGLKTGRARALINGVVICIGIYFSFPGELASVLLVWAVEFLFRPGADRPQAAAGPALWTESSVLSGNTKILLAAVAITLSAIAVALTGRMPGIVGAVIILVAVWFSRLRKE
jgi:hypothetical protein